jgi:hypothetical protein
MPALSDDQVKTALGGGGDSCTACIAKPYEIPPSSLPSDESIGPQLLESPLTPADELFAKVRELLKKITTPKNDAEVATDLQVSKSQAEEWLQRLVDEGVLEKLSRPVRYRSVSSQASLFERRD